MQLSSSVKIEPGVGGAVPAVQSHLPSSSGSSSSHAPVSTPSSAALAAAQLSSRQQPPPPAHHQQGSLAALQRDMLLMHQQPPLWTGNPLGSGTPAYSSSSTTMPPPSMLSAIRHPSQMFMPTMPLAALSQQQPLGSTAAPAPSSSSWPSTAVVVGTDMKSTSASAGGSSSSTLAPSELMAGGRKRSHSRSRRYSPSHHEDDGDREGSEPSSSWDRGMLPSEASDSNESRTKRQRKQTGSTASASSSFSRELDNWLDTSVETTQKDLFNDAMERWGDEKFAREVVRMSTLRWVQVLKRMRRWMHSQGEQLSEAQMLSQQVHAVDLVMPVLQQGMRRVTTALLDNFVVWQRMNPSPSSNLSSSGSVPEVAVSAR